MSLRWAWHPNCRSKRRIWGNKDDRKQITENRKRAECGSIAHRAWGKGQRGRSKDLSFFRDRPRKKWPVEGSKSANNFRSHIICFRCRVSGFRIRLIYALRSLKYSSIDSFPAGQTAMQRSHRVCDPPARFYHIEMVSLSLTLRR
jgi:hypothetical protein